MTQFLFLLLAILSCQHDVKTQSLDCDSPIYCQGQLLDIVQRNVYTIFNDSKTFVDLVQTNSPNVTLQNFQNLLTASDNNPTQEQVLNFLNENFESSDELVPWTPSDFNESPDFLNKISNAEVKLFAQALVNIWPVLARKINESVNKEPEKHSLISLPNGFIIPGGRFKEIYYWDTYWIVKGLLISGMADTVRGILENFISLVTRYGFIPNGSRIYYLNRSEPPLLALMVGLYMEATNNTAWLVENIETMEQELYWWLDNRVITVDKFGEKYTLAQYNCKSGTPRPESYSEDLISCGSFENEEKTKCYKNLKSAAEAGWDFSSRWLLGPNGSISSNLSLINTTRIVPVDLNAFLSGSFKTISWLFKIIGNIEKSQEWIQRYEQWQQSIQEVLYNEEDNIWYDWDIELSKHRKGFFPSNFAPLWTGTYDKKNSDKIGENAVRYLESNNITNYLGGIPTSLLKSGQQWDFPNAWPPQQEIVILGLLQTKNERAINISRLLAQNILTAYMTGYNNTKEMFEKYDAVNVGEYGGGGEYTVQSGFGWTNGVALSLIELLYVQ